MICSHMGQGDNNISFFLHFCAGGWSGKSLPARAGSRIRPIRSRHGLGRAVPRRTVQKLASGTEIEASSGRFCETVPRIFDDAELLSALMSVQGRALGGLGTYNGQGTGAI